MAASSRAVSSRDRTTGIPAGPLGTSDVLEPRQVDAANASVQEQYRGERLLVGGCRHVALDGEVSEKSFDLRCAHFSRVPQMMKADEAPDPEDVCLLGAQAVVQIPDLLDQLIEQPNRS